MTVTSRRAWATIDLRALRHNLARVRALCPDAGIYPIIKSNAYGHGMAQVAAALQDSPVAIAGLGVATVDEALRLRPLVPGLPVLLLSGCMTSEEMGECLQQRIEPVMHSDYQVRLLATELSRRRISVAPQQYWLKYNTGMNRLGMDRQTTRQSWCTMRAMSAGQWVLMSHLACADQPDNPAFADFTRRQLAALLRLHRELRTIDSLPMPVSMAASAGILRWPDTHLDIVRPGIMLYGGSPLVEQTGADLGLQTVMTLSSRIIAIHSLQAGDSVGYGATHVCDRPTRVGTVSIGYGDGYPRSAENGTPVVVRTAAGSTRTRLLGRVSMDLITIDLSGVKDVQIDDEVVLWGTEPGADEVARASATIAYELFCKITPRVLFEYRN